MKTTCYISHEAMDCLVEFMGCNHPLLLEDRELMNGIFFLMEENARQFVERERERQRKRIEGVSSC